MDTETVDIPKESLVERVIEGAKEYGQVVAEPTYGERGRPDKDVDWSFEDVDTWSVEILDDGNFALVGVASGSYSVKTLSATYNPPGKAHPAEYERRSVPVGIEIRVDTVNPPDGLWSYEIEARVQ